MLARRRARVVTGEWGELCGWSGGGVCVSVPRSSEKGGLVTAPRAREGANPRRQSGAAERGVGDCAHPLGLVAGLREWRRVR